MIKEYWQLLDFALHCGTEPSAETPPVDPLMMTDKAAYTTKKRLMFNLSRSPDRRECWFRVVYILGTHAALSSLILSKLCLCAASDYAAGMPDAMMRFQYVRSVDSVGDFVIQPEWRQLIARRSASRQHSCFDNFQSVG